MSAFVCLVILCVCVVPGATICLLASFSPLSLSLSFLSPSCVHEFTPLLPSSIPLQVTPLPLLLCRPRSPSLLSACRRRVASLAQSAVSGAESLPSRRSLPLFASLSLFVPSCSKPALPLFPRSFPLSRSHTLHTHTRSIPRLVIVLVPTPVA